MVAVFTLYTRHILSFYVILGKRKVIAMHARHRRRHRKTVFLVISILILLVAAAAAVWFFLPRSADRTLPSATVPTQRIKGLSLRLDGQNGFTAQETVSAQKDFLQKFITFAAEHGHNAVFVDAAASSGETLYRLRGTKPLENLAKNDTFFNKFNAFSYLCAQASDKKIAVYAVFQSAVSKELSEKLQKKYPVAGVFLREGSTLKPFTEGTELPLTSAQDWAQPSNIFLQSVEKTFSGIVIDDYRAAQEKPEAYSIMMSALFSENAAPQPAFSFPQGLSVAYPTDGEKTTSDAIYVMGTSDPAQPLFCNGTEVARTAMKGTFGVLAPLAEGANTLTLTQGAQTVTLNIERTVPKKKTDTGDKKLPHDATEEVPAGTFVQINGWIASLLSDPSNDGNISETVRQGAIARVTNCVETTRKGKTTWAYQLASGDFILAYNVTALAEAPRASFSAAAAETALSGETLRFVGSGTPLTYTNAVENTLVLHFYDTDFAADFAVQNSGMVKSATVTAQENYTEVVLGFDAPLWGHSVEYENGSVVVTLKKTPQKSAVFGKPLTGVTVLLDAGHGADDNGAMGAAGPDAPQEKDVNLAVTLAAKYRLEQLGATVATICTDDTFLTLADRNKQITTTQPDFFISVHHNSIERNRDANETKGTEAYYFYPAGKALAQNLVETFAAQLGRQNRGAMWGYYYVTRSTVCPSVLLEIGYMPNPAEYEQITDSTQILKTGNAIADSILATLS